MEEVRVGSWGELCEEVFFASWRPELQRFRSNYAFRGMSDATYPLQASLKRSVTDPVELEGHLLRNFRKYAHKHLAQSDTVWQALALAQHHGLPTRLMDWTYSPFVAMHFATANVETMDLDGVVWALDIEKAWSLAPTRMREKMDEHGSFVFTAEMLAEVTEELSALEDYADEPYLIFFEPPSLDDRIVNQYALFTMMSSANADLSAWLASHPEAGRKVVIPAELKWEVRDKLDQSGVNERVLFPGLDGVSSWLARRYSPAKAPCPEDPQPGRPYDNPR